MKKLRCCAYYGRSANQTGYWGICLDTGSITFRKSLMETKKSLRDAVTGYLELANTEEGFVTNGLPLWPWRFYYMIISFLNKFLKSTWWFKWWWGMDVLLRSEHVAES